MEKGEYFLLEKHNKVCSMWSSHECITKLEMTKNFASAQNVFSPYNTIINEMSVQLLTGHLELQTSSIMTFYNDSLFMEVF